MYQIKYKMSAENDSSISKILELSKGKNKENHTQVHKNYKLQKKCGFQNKD